MFKVKAADTIVIYVKANPSRRVNALVTQVSNKGVVYFRPLKTLPFELYPDRATQQTTVQLVAGLLYSTNDINNLVFTGRYKDLLGIAIPTQNDELKVEELPKHDYGTARFTTKADANGEDSLVVDKAQDFFKAFSSVSQHHHYFKPQTKLGSMLTSKCEDAKKLAEEVYEASCSASEVVEENQFERAIRTMMKAGLTPHQIAEEIQRQFYNAMVNE